MFPNVKLTEIKFFFECMMIGVGGHVYGGHAVFTNQVVCDKVGSSLCGC